MACGKAAGARLDEGRNFVFESCRGGLIPFLARAAKVGLPNDLVDNIAAAEKQRLGLG